MSSTNGTRSYFRVGVAALGVVAASGVVVMGGMVGSASAAGIQETIPGNPDCEDLGFANEFKIDGSGQFPAEGTYADGDEGTESKGDAEGFSVEITYTDDDPLTFDFAASIPVGAVLVKAGPGASAYAFEPPSSEGSGLESPVDDSISHLTFCWNEGTTTTTTVPGETTTTTPGGTTTVPGATTVPGGGAPLPVPPAATPVIDEPDFTG